MDLAKSITMNCKNIVLYKQEGQCTVIVTVGTPDLAEELYKYGNGNKVLSEVEILWINADLTNYNTRERSKL